MELDSRLEASDLVSLIVAAFSVDTATPRAARDLFLRPHPQFPGLTGDSANSLQLKHWLLKIGM